MVCVWFQTWGVVFLRVRCNLVCFGILCFGSILKDRAVLVEKSSTNSKYGHDWRKHHVGNAVQECTGIDCVSDVVFYAWPADRIYLFITGFGINDKSFVQIFMRKLFRSFLECTNSTQNWFSNCLQLMSHVP